MEWEFCPHLYTHFGLRVSVPLLTALTSHGSFLRDIISSSSERHNILVLLHLGGKEEKTERPIAV